MAAAGGLLRIGPTRRSPVRESPSRSGAIAMIDLVECPHCATRVLPMAGRVCPACRKNVDSPPDPAPPREQAIDAAYGFAAQQMQYGVAPSGIRQSLTERGLDAREASVVV